MVNTRADVSFNSTACGSYRPQQRLLSAGEASTTVHMCTRVLHQAHSG